MKRIFTFIASAVLALTVTAAPATTAKETAKSALSHKLFRFAPKAKADMRGIGASANANTIAQQRAKGTAQVEAVTQNFVINGLPTADEHGYLDGPNNETWYYTMTYDKDVVNHGSWTETLIKGYKITVYNAALQEVGKVEDVVELGEKETKVAQIEVGTLITQKFFNYDNSYEIMIGISCNTTEYVNNYRTKAYSIGNNNAIASFDGYYVSAVNTATDAWSEKFWITFLTEEETTTPDVNGIINTADNVYTTYKSAGYSGMGDPVLKARIPSITIPGENAVPFISTAHNGQPYFLLNHLKYCWYENPFDYENDNPTADNRLICDIYTPPSAWASTVELYSTTTIASDATKDNSYFLYCGAFSYNDDLSFDRYTTDGTPSLIITREHFIPSHDGYTYDFSVYNTAPKTTEANGDEILSLAKGVEIGYFMNDIPGADPQVMFATSDASGAYTFDFVNLVTAEKEFSLDSNLGDDIFVTTQTDRIASANGYLLVCPQTVGTSDADGNMFTSVAYVNTDGSIDHIDKLNLGKDIDLAQIYSGTDAFNPYIFNVDDAREYLVLVKRRNVSGQTGNHEELLVISSDPEKGYLLQLTPDDELGTLRTISLANLDNDNPSLVINYLKDNQMSTQVYSLPLSLYEEGDGTVENPYVITTLGGLQQIKANPSANYVLGCDIDAAGAELKHTSAYSFSGSLDGQNHIISNLKIVGRPFIPNIVAAEGTAEGSQGATVKNINFLNPEFTANGSNTGLLTANATGAMISNIHVYGGKVTGEESIAGLVGKASLYTNISECSFNGEVTCTGDEAAAGIAGTLQTSSTISACAFNGTINGGSSLGGIVSETHSNAGTIANCHVKADIKGKNTIGGIVGSSQRAPIVNCHVEGTIEATEAPRWGGGPKTGGIAGELTPAISAGNEGEGTGEATETTAVIKGCYVNLTSFTYSGEAGEETFAGQNDTMHRIVGSTAVNYEPEVTGYDSEWNPIYGEPNAPEAALADNYAVATLAKVADAIADETTTTEGKSVAADETGMGFFMELGWAYGYDAESPWAMVGDYTRPSLHFEGGLLIATPAETTVHVGDSFTVEVSLAGEDITEAMFDSFSFEMTDESLFEMGDMGVENGKMFFNFTAIKVGKATISFNLNGKSATAVITVSEIPSSIGEVKADKATISINGRTATAEGCTLDVFSTTGSHLKKGNGSVSLSGLPAGVYVIKATSAKGEATTKKVALK